MSPSLDNWTSLFLLAAGFGVFIFLLLIINSRNKFNYPIAFLVLSFSLILVQYVLYWSGYQRQFPYLIQLPAMCYYASGPLLFIYFYKIYSGEFKRLFLLNFLPSLLILISALVFILKGGFKVEGNTWLFRFLFNPWVITLSMSVYAGLIFKLIRDNTPKEPSEFASVRTKWATFLIGLYTIFILAYVSYYVLVEFPFFNSQWDYMISMMLTISIYGIGFMAFKQPAIFNGEMFSALFLPAPADDSKLEAKLINEFYDNLVAFMKKEKLYLDSELRMVNVADQIGYSTHMLSQVINEKYGKNFNQFINDHRLEEAEELLRSASDYSIKNICYDVGFNNKATFYTSFKKKYHCTPLEFKQQQVSSAG